MAAKSIKLVLQLVLQQDWQEAENRKADKKTNTEGKKINFVIQQEGKNCT